MHAFKAESPLSRTNERLNGRNGAEPSFSQDPASTEVPNALHFPSDPRKRSFLHTRLSVRQKPSIYTLIEVTVSSISRTLSHGASDGKKSPLASPRKKATYHSQKENGTLLFVFAKYPFVLHGGYLGGRAEWHQHFAIDKCLLHATLIFLSLSLARILLSTSHLVCRSDIFFFSDPSRQISLVGCRRLASCPSRRALFYSYWRAF